MTHMEALEVGGVLQFSKVQWRLVVGSGRPDGYQPAIARMPVLPVLAVLGATAQDDVQYDDRA